MSQIKRLDAIRRWSQRVPLKVDMSNVSAFGQDSDAGSWIHTPRAAEGALGVEKRVYL